MNNEQISNPIDLTTPTTKILAIGRWTEKGMDPKTRFPVMVKEVPATVRLYLTGKIEMWYVKPDISGVVFIMNITDPAEAHQLLEKLPLGIAGMMEFDFIPLGPISPLRFLLPDDTAA
ncbi:hypothetical protein [Mucilaginibacter sp.]|uniref:hypothetical protein n=1 Tax=Mucilaginibacter sp. TaxID=1882438 RepID=UPI002606E418|nr:hypothetical protein [Mucilaginibacter sp.]MDB5129826.1 hypothetical protein [Mucilaginibacter sp.]